MKISDSAIHLSSYHASEEVDVIQEEKSSRTRVGRAPAPRRGISWTGWGGAEDIPTAMVDRVSISNRFSREIQSEYRSGISSQSRVKSGTEETVLEFENRALVERLLGEVMDREVTVRTLRDGDDIRSGNDISAGFEAGLRTGARSSKRLVTRDRTRIHFEQEQMGFSSRGRVLAQDGREIEFSLDLDMDRAFLSRIEEQTLVQSWQERVNLVDPLVISLDGSIPELTDIRFEFDLDNDGTREEISFVSKGSGFLSFDRNNDGKINNGSELFGPGTGNGFKELGEYDLDKNGWIDENDAVFSQLTVWTRDDQGNDVLTSLKDAGIGAVYLDNAQAEFNMTTMDNTLKGQVRQSGLFLFENGNVGTVQQIDLAARAPETGMKNLSGSVASPSVFQQQSPSEVGLSTDMADTSGRNGETENPFQALIDQIKALREEVQQILGRGKPGRDPFVSPGSKALSLSNFQLYRMTRPGPSGFYSNRFWEV